MNSMKGVAAQASPGRGYIYALPKVYAEYRLKTKTDTGISTNRHMYRLFILNLFVDQRYTNSNLTRQ